MSILRSLVLLSAGLFLITMSSAQSAKRAMMLEDIFKMKNVSNPQISPDGAWVAYVVSTVDVKADRSSSDIWMVSYDGKTHRQITFTATESENQPRWSPDGRYLSFVSSRPGPNRGSQIWLLDTRGGEARQLTDAKGGIQGYEWSPDSKRLVMVIRDPDPDAPASDVAPSSTRPPKPIVIDRYRFKQDGQGYLVSNRKSYLNIFDIQTKKFERLTKGNWDESAPTWSPDGTRIAFLSNRKADPDRDNSFQVFIADARPGSTEKAVTPAANRVRGGALEWSPDSRWLAFLENDEIRYDAYQTPHLALVRSDGSEAPVRLKSVQDIDRGVGELRFSDDGSRIYFFITDDRSVIPASAKLSGGAVERMITPPFVGSSWSWAKDRVVMLVGSNDRPNEIFAFEGGTARQLTKHNDEVFSGLDLPPTESIEFTSPDGTRVGALLTYPVGYRRGAKVPFLLRIHGGPNAQDQHSFSAERHFFAANGYAVMAINYRGSSGRGKAFSRAIAADWGNLEVVDLLAGVDHAVKIGVADPEKLGVGGWSYGSILTNYLIATDTRFKGATSGAGTAFTVSYYGVDHYITQYDNEIGPPWEPKAWETYQKLSYPFLKANRIKTPTLFLGGERDFNVPISGSEQMYQALRSLGVETQLIIYPNENHGIQRPSYVRDRYERYLAWYDKHVKKLPVEAKPMIAKWEGTWKGDLTNLPAKPDAPKVEVTMEIGVFPSADGECTKWASRYDEAGEVKAVKDYKLCRGKGVNDLFIDEGGGVRLPVRIIGDALVSTFKFNEVLLISTMRLRGDVLEHEILSVDDRPAAGSVIPMVPKGVQRIELRRVP